MEQTGINQKQINHRGAESAELFIKQYPVYPLNPDYPDSAFM
jgi:hypothetical protein